MAYDLVSRFNTLEEFFNADQSESAARTLIGGVTIRLDEKLYINLSASINGSDPRFEIEVLARVFLAIDNFPVKKTNNNGEPLRKPPYGFERRLYVSKALSSEKEYASKLSLNGAVSIGYRLQRFNTDKDLMKKCPALVMEFLREAANESLMNASSELLEISNLTRMLASKTFTPETINSIRLATYNERPVNYKRDISSPYEDVTSHSKNSN